MDKEDIKLHTNLIRQVYSKFVASNSLYRTTSRIRHLGKGVTSAVYLVNSNVIGKVSSFTPSGTSQPPGFTEIQADNKRYVWDYLQSQVKDKPAEKYLSFPLYRAILTEANMTYLVTLEPYIPGDTLYTMLNNKKLTEVQVADILVIIIDVLYYLGTHFFNHNDFHLNNIMIVRADTIFETGNTYTSLNNASYVLNKVTYVPVIIDYDWATIDCPQSINNTVQCRTVNQLVRDLFTKLPNNATVFNRVHSEAGRSFGNYSNKADLYALMLNLESYFTSLQWNSVHIYLKELVGRIESNTCDVSKVWTYIMPGLGSINSQFKV
jgi:hypothetical protein